MNDSVPDTMQALQLAAYDIDLDIALRGLKVNRVPTPVPGRYQVLVKVEAAPCNPSDLLLLQGMYGVTKALPTVPGWECAGTVVAAGPGVRDRWLLGKRVACACQSDQPGTWAEYFLADSFSCIPLSRDIPIEQGAALIINPFTAVGLFERAISAGHGAAVQTAAAGQVGRMIASIAAQRGFPLISVVRRRKQLDLLKALGAHLVLDSEAENFKETLAATCRDVGATMAFDAVAGSMTGTLLEAMPPGSEVVVYGALSYEPCAAIDPIALIFQNKRVSGFYLGSMMKQLGFIRRMQLTKHVKDLVERELIETTVRRRVSLREAPEAISNYAKHMSDGKILISPQQAAPGAK